MVFGNVFSHKLAFNPVRTLCDLRCKNAGVVSCKESGGIGVGSDASHVRLVIGSEHSIKVTDAQVWFVCSNIALEKLKELGFKRVRDIGGFEEARKVLDREQVQRQLDAEMEKSMGQTAKEAGKEDEPKKHVRVKSFGALVDGLKALEN